VHAPRKTTAGAAREETGSRWSQSNSSWQLRPCCDVLGLRDSTCAPLIMLFLSSCSPPGDDVQHIVQRCPVSRQTRELDQRVPQSGCGAANGPNTIRVSQLPVDACTRGKLPVLSPAGRPRAICSACLDAPAFLSAAWPGLRGRSLHGHDTSDADNIAAERRDIY